MSDDEPARWDDGEEELSGEVEAALLLEGYLSDLEAGRPVDPEQLIAAHPQFAGQLRACLEVMGLPFGASAEPEEAGGPAKVPSTAARPGSGRLTSCFESDDRLPRVLLSGPEDDEAAPVLTRSKSPLRVGRYQILGEIARGGMGAVLRARDEGLGRELALKVLLLAPTAPVR